jgi:hypothetical protein
MRKTTRQKNQRANRRAPAHWTAKKKGRRKSQMRET